MEAIDWSSLEAREGVRFSWNMLPNSRLEANRLAVPIGCMCTPLKELEEVPLLPYSPQQCKQCESVLNPYCQVDFGSHVWVCNFCFARNHFPPEYSGISESNLPTEVIGHYQVVEYQLPYSTNIPSAPCLIFIVDTCLERKEFECLKASLLEAIAKLPENTMIGLVSFGTMVHVHELGRGTYNRSTVFDGRNEYTFGEIIRCLGLTSNVNGHGLQNRCIKPIDKSNYIVTVEDGEFAISSALEDICENAFDLEKDCRPLRASGCAIMVAAALAKGCNSASFGSFIPTRIVSFLGGPCTVGSGITVGPDLGEAIRCHQDFEKGPVKHFHKSVKFFEAVANEIIASGHTLDVFSCSLDQVGLAELKVCIEASGGEAVLTETFNCDEFKSSLHHFLRKSSDGQLDMFFNSSLEVHLSREIKVCGAIGPISSNEKESAYVSNDIEIGIGNTSSWRLCSLNKNTTISIFFDIVNHSSNQLSQGSAAFFQFVCRFMTSSGQNRMRVSTIARRWLETGDDDGVTEGFDQETAAAIVARYACLRAETEDSFDVIRWLDRMLIRICSRFGEFENENPNSFHLRSNFSIYPQFMFHLRRSQFLQVFGNSPDETAFFRLCLQKASVINSLVMILPTLQCYSMDGPPIPVLLDVSSLVPDKILLLDSFFQVVVFHGATVAQWKSAGYHEDPTYEAFKNFLEDPVEDAKEILSNRFPVPRLVICDQNGSQSRFLLAKLNPSATHNNPGAGEMIFTDDASLQVFMNHLQKLSVSS